MSAALPISVGIPLIDYEEVTKLEFKGEVSMALSPSNFYLNILEDALKYPQFVNKLHRFYNNPNIDNRYKVKCITDLHAGRFIAVFYYELWMRGCFYCKTNEKNELKILILDSGEVFYTTLDNIRYLDKEFLEFPVQAVPAKLAFLHPKEENWSKKACKKFSEYFMDREILVACYFNKPDPKDGRLAVCLLDSNKKSLDRFLITEGYAVYPGEKMKLEYQRQILGSVASSKPAPVMSVTNPDNILHPDMPTSDLQIPEPVKNIAVDVQPVEEAPEDVWLSSSKTSPTSNDAEGNVVDDAVDMELCVDSSQVEGNIEIPFSFDRKQSLADLVKVDEFVPSSSPSTLNPMAQQPVVAGEVKDMYTDMLVEVLRRINLLSPVTKNNVLSSASLTSAPPTDTTNSTSESTPFTQRPPRHTQSRLPPSSVAMVQQPYIQNSAPLLRPPGFDHVTPPFATQQIYQAQTWYGAPPGFPILHPQQIQQIQKKSSNHLL